MPVPSRPTTGQKATITRGLNLQAATKKDVDLLGKRIDAIEKQLGKQIEVIEKQLAKAQKEILRAVKKATKAAKRRRGK